MYIAAILLSMTACDQEDPEVQRLEARVLALETELATYRALMEYVEVDPRTDSVRFVGANVYIQSGAGATNGNPDAPDAPWLGRTNGVGNLIIGYDEDLAEFDEDPNLRGGSHNLVIGPYHDYTSFGGLVAGAEHAAYSPYATIAGGWLNLVEQEYAAVVGGMGNDAAGYASTVTGGLYNETGGWYATVTGGADNVAIGDYAAVLGGEFNDAEGDVSSVTGGEGNFAGGDYAAVTGGSYNTADGDASSIHGGVDEYAGGDFEAVP